MVHYPLSDIVTRVSANWKNNEYSEAEVALSAAIDLALKHKDFDDWSELVHLLYLTYTLEDRHDVARELLTSSIRYRPSDLRLHICLAEHCWITEKSPARASQIIQDYLSTNRQNACTEDLISAENYLVRAYIAQGRVKEAVNSLDWVVRHLPLFSPPKAYLFDLDTINEAFKAGVRDPILRDYVNKIQEPKWFVNSISTEEFQRIREELMNHQEKQEKNQDKGSG